MSPQPSPVAERISDHAWRYFEIHANQRLTLFNYFLFLSGLLAAGLAACVQGTGYLPLLGFVLGLLLVAVPFVFWKLDQRTSFFVKRAERALEKLETNLPDPALQLFLNEPQATCNAKKAASFWNPHLTYGQSFRVVFFFMGAVGLFGGVFSLVRYLGYL